MNEIPENMRFGGGSSASTIHPVILVAMLIAMLLIFLLPRKYVIVPFLLTALLTPFGENIYVAGVHIFVPRILVMVGWLRVLIRDRSSEKEMAPGGFSPIDKIFVWWAVCRAVATCLEFLQVQAVINQCGFLIDAIGGFLLIRFLIRDEEDIERVVKVFAFIVVLLASTMLNEKFRGLNVFGYIGGRLAPFIRDGAIRSQGPFVGPIPAGTFAGTLFCLLVWLWKSKRSVLIGGLGMVGAVVMIVTSASSTPLLAFAGALLAMAFWPFRKSMRAIRWAIVIVLVTLHLVMKAPVWMLINHIDLTSGNSGYHRAMLIDGLVRHFSDWWLIGVTSTVNWGWDMWDQANQFVAEGESGGLATLVCFIMIISRCFGRLGTARKLIEGDPKKELLVWLLGSALFSHVVSFFGISFSDQSGIAWYTLLVSISLTTSLILKPGTIPVPNSGKGRPAASALKGLSRLSDGHKNNVRDEVEVSARRSATVNRRKVAEPI